MTGLLQTGLFGLLHCKTVQALNFSLEFLVAWTFILYFMLCFRCGCPVSSANT